MRVCKKSTYTPSWLLKYLLNAIRCIGKDNAVRERMQCGDFIGAPHWFFWEEMSGEWWAVSTQMSSWTCFRISQRAISRTSPRTDAETSSAWQEDRKMRGERKNATRCVGKDNAVRERMQCGDFIEAPHCLFLRSNEWWNFRLDIKDLKKNRFFCSSVKKINLR